MTWSWFKIINLDVFEDTELVSLGAQVNFQGLGLKNVLITKGNFVSVTYEGIFLSLGMSDKNPFVFEGNGIYLDENNDIWWGIVNED